MEMSVARAGMNFSMIDWERARPRSGRRARQSPTCWSGDVSERAAQARALLDTPQGATLLDLLGDPTVRERLMATATAGPP
jgi:hypothetical protein